MGRLERGEIRERSNRWTGRFAYERAGIVDRDWFELYSFRDGCACVVCPELYFATSGKDRDEAQTNFDALRREKYAEFWRSPKRCSRACRKGKRERPFAQRNNNTARKWRYCAT